MRAAVIAWRLLGAAAAFAAVFVQLASTLTYWTANEARDLGVSAVNFFSFFTIQSNLIAAVMLTVGAILLLRSVGTDPRWFAWWRASAATYLATTGIIYNTLLRGIELPQGLTVVWSNEVLHVVMPLILVVDWLAAPGRRRLRWGVLGVILAYPLLWAVYTMVRAPFVFSDAMQRYGWYPYPFLDPANGGLASVAVFIALISGAIAAVGAGVIAVSRMQPRRGRLTRVA